MLSTQLYVEDLNRTIDNCKAAMARGESTDAFFNHLIHLLDYASSHGLVLTTRNGKPCFRRNGYAPEFLYIDIA